MWGEPGGARLHINTSVSVTTQETDRPENRKDTLSVLVFGGPVSQKPHHVERTTIIGSGDTTGQELGGDKTSIYFSHRES